MTFNQRCGIYTKTKSDFPGVLRYPESGTWFELVQVQGNTHVNLRDVSCVCGTHLN